ncbi:MAG: tRNA (N6-isopentenyl adenosine(37)-C2)-methylthiotransferase MiaB [Clostridia bacterium]|nr:tRNA (N6-isopentenyl adenosine(37)-C2)-methylthiotransferase MiaB [Clostridia bacterium]
MPKFYKIITYGCQMNIHDSEKLAGMLALRGYVENDDESLCDVIVFNTCCIRENAEDHAFGNIGALKQLKKRKPSLIIAVGGCMAQQAGEAEIIREKFPFVDIIFGTHNLDEFGILLDRKLSSNKKIVEIKDESGKIIEGVKPLRTSYPNAWVSIMQGCNNFCTYCIVPYVRGRERSRELMNIYAEVNVLVMSGYKEITLLGQNVNSYGKDLGDGTDFATLIEKLSEIKGDYRLRFMTNHPKDLTEKLINAVAKNEHCCHQIHLPLQSGSDRILKLMNRHYDSADYLREIEMIKKYMPDCAVSTDLMIGFPSETEEDFLDTLKMCEKVGFSSCFTFVYSRRRGTPADKMPDQVPDDVKKDRIMRLVECTNEKTRQFSSRYVGKTVRILCEDIDKKKNMYIGRDEYGRMGYFPSSRNVIGEFVDMKVTSANGISLFGEIE